MSTITAAILGWILTTEAAAISGWSVRGTVAILGWPPTTTFTQQQREHLHEEIEPLH